MSSSGVKLANSSSVCFASRPRSDADWHADSASVSGRGQMFRQASGVLGGLRRDAGECGGGEVEVVAVLHEPAGRDEFRVDVVAGFLFGGVGHGQRGTEGSPSNRRM